MKRAPFPAISESGCAMRAAVSDETNTIDRMCDAYAAGQERGWNDALDAGADAIRNCASLAASACEKSAALAVLTALRRNTFSTRDKLTTALIRIIAEGAPAEIEKIAREALS